MKILLVSDIHANLDALTAVLDETLQSVDGLVCLGDITGYGPDDEACVQRLRDVSLDLEESLVLAGNHDAALGGGLALTWFNTEAQESIKRSASLLSMESMEWLSSLLPQGYAEFGAERVYAVHGSPIEPLTGYILDKASANLSFNRMEASGLRRCFFGHTHECALWKPGVNIGAIAGYPDIGKSFVADSYLFNPGSVGWPRYIMRPEYGADGIGQDSLWPAWYALWETDTGKIQVCTARYDPSSMLARLADRDKR